MLDSNVILYYHVSSHFVLFPDEVPVCQEGINFTGRKQVHEDLIRLSLHDPCLFNEWRSVVKLIVVINCVVV